jgi:diketogulonate reductase-like aldo/keto reductase
MSYVKVRNLSLTLNFRCNELYVISSEGVIPLGGARDAKQAEQNAGALGWRLTNEQITELESHPFTPYNPFWSRFWQHA